MKKLVMWTIVSAFAISLLGCSTMSSPSKDTIRAKCPSCGYEFEVDVSSG